MHYYPKILAPFKRETNKSKYVNESLWSKPEFKMLKDVEWVWTAKADGTSIKLYWNGDKVQFFGHTDKSQLSKLTLDYLNNTFGTPEAESVFESLYGSNEVNVYGEFCSKEMNEDYGHQDGIFYVFDVQNATSGKWWDRNAVLQFAESFNIQAVPIMLRGTITEAVEFVKLANRTWNKDFKCVFYHRKCENTSYNVSCPFAHNVKLEGLVGRLSYEILDANGERIITKVKCKDFDNSDNFKEKTK